MKKLLFLLFLTTITTFSLAQNGPKWSTGGNGVVSGDFIGTTNNFALLFKVNNALKMTLNTNGTLQLNNFGGAGSGLVKYDNNGVLIQLPFTSSTDVLYGNGTFGPLNFSGSGWTANGNDLFYNGSGNVGIGTNTPAYKLDVTGNIRVTGTVFTSGVLISNQVQSNSANLGTINGTSTDITGNANVGGNVGIGTTNPSAKLDVFGNANVSGDVNAGNLNISGVSTFTNKIQTSRITGLPGDTVIHFGDSSILFSTSFNRMWGGNSNGNSGIALGQSATGKGVRSVALGSGVTAFATQSIAIGSGSSSILNNTIANSLWVGFNSNIPTLFVSPANGVGTTGTVCIGTTQIPDANNLSRKYKLAVAGTIIATEIEVKLQNAWPDFVYDPTYELLSLSDRKKYSDIYHHMPHMKSAEEMVKDGNNLGQTISNLTQNVEEHDKYLFAHDQRLNNLEKENIDLKNKNEELEKRLEKLEKKNK